MIFSRKCEYAIRALTHLAQFRQTCGAREISHAQGVPYPFMAKVLYALKRGGFVRSIKGAKGGFVLARPPREIRLLDIVAAVDGSQGLERCLYGFPNCSEESPCPLHEDWKELRGTIEAFLMTRTVAHLGERRAKHLEVLRLEGTSRD